MQTDIASLVLKVDALQVKEGETALYKFTVAGKQAEDQVKRTASSVDVLTRLYRDLGIAATAYKVLDQVKEMTMLNARYQELGVVQGVVGRNAGYTAEQMEQAARGMQKLGISMLESRNTTVQLAQAQINLADAGRLARVAQDTAVIGNINSSEALQRMVYGIKSGQLEVLRTIGINVNFEQSYKKLADELNKTTAALTEKEKMQARENAVLEEGAKLNGAYEASMGTAGKQIRSMTRYLEDLKVMRGEVFNEALTVAVMAFVDQLKEANHETQELSRNGNLKQWGTDVADTLAFVADSLLSVKALIGIVTQGIGAVAAKAAIKWDNSLGSDERNRMLANIDAEYDAYVNGQLNLTHALRDSLATRRAAHAKDVTDRLKLDAEYAEKSLIVQKAYAGYSIEIQRAAQLSLAQAMYPQGFPTEAKDNSPTGVPTSKSVDKVKEFVSALEKEAAALGRSTEEKKLNEAIQLKVTGATMAHVQALILEMSQYQLAEEQARTRAELRNKEYSDIVKFQEAENLRLIEVGNAADKAVEAARAEYQQYGLTKSAVLSLTLAKMEDALKTKTYGTAAYDSLQRQINAQKELISIASSTEIRDASLKAAKEIGDEWNRLTGQVEQSLSDALMNGFTSGKGFAQSFVDSVTAMFKTMVLRPGASATVGGITGSLGLGSTASSAASSLGSLSNIGSVFSGASSIGNFAGTTMANITGTGLDGFLATNAAFGTAIESGVSAAMSGLMTAAPYLAAIAAVYMIAKKLDHSGTPHTGAGTSYSAADGVQQASSGASGAGLFSTGIDYDSATEQMTTKLATSMVGVLDATAVAFGKTAGYQVALSYADDKSKDGAYAAVAISKLGELISSWGVWKGNGQVLPDGEAGTAEFLSRATSDMRSAIMGIIPGWAKSMLDQVPVGATLEELSTAISAINSTKTALDSMGNALKGFSSLSDEAITKLLAASGGIANLTSEASSYYQNFYSEDEKRANSFDQIRQTLAAVNVVLPDTDKLTHNWLRTEVERNQALGTSGMDAVAALLSVNEAFNALVPAADAAATASSTVSEAMQRLQEETSSLQDELFLAQGGDQRTIDIRGLSEAEVAVYDYNASIRSQISDLSDAAEANRIANENRIASEQRIANERQGLQDQLDSLTMTSTQLLDKQRNALDASNQALFDQVQAATAAAEAEQAQAEITRAIASERQSLQDQLDELTMSATELLDKQRNALDESNRSLFDQIQAVTAATKASEEEQAAREQAARDAEQAAKAAQDAINRAAEAAAQAAAQVAQQRDGLWKQYLTAIGDTAALRKLELEALDPSNRALQEQIWMLEDQKKMLDEQQKAAEEAATAAQQMKSAWASLTDSLLDEVRRIRGLIGESSGAGYASLQAQFAIATAQTRAGDQEAAKLLPGLSQGLLSAYESTATTLVDLQRLRALTANSLEQTATLVAGGTGAVAPVVETSGGRSRGTAVGINRDTTYTVTPAAPAYGLADMVVELRGEIAALKGEVKGLRDEAKTTSETIAINTGKSARLAQKWDDIGLPITTETDLAAVYGA